jgi:hypothetical protein
MAPRSKKPKPAPASIVKEQIEAARLLGVTDRSLRTWMRDPGFPDCSAGYDIAAIKTWQDANRRAGSDAREQAQQLQLALKREKVAQEAIKTQQMERKLEELEGGLLPRRTIELALATVLTKHGDWCDQLPDLIRGECCKSCRKRIPDSLQTELDERRKALATELQNLPLS